MLEAQRGLLGDADVDVALAPLRTQLTALATPTTPAALGSSTANPAEQALRLVSILFLDIVGSTSLSRQLDRRKHTG